VDHTRLGRTGLHVSKLCLGTMTFGLQCDEKASVAILDRAAAAGITFIDTADVYPPGGPVEAVGLTEEILGRWMKGRRDAFVVATKGFGPTSLQPWDQGNSRKHLLDAIDASLRRLQTDYVDLYQLHEPDPYTPLDETLRALEDIVRAGKARYVGCSNFLAYQLARAVGRAEALGLVRFDSVQPRYNLLFRAIERELLPFCAEEGIGVIPYNPIAGGFLSGKHDRAGGAAEGSRFTAGRVAEVYRSRYWHEDMFETVDMLRGIAAEAGLSTATLALAWVLANPVITAAIVGASRPEHLDDLLVAVDTPLPADLKRRLDDLTYGYRRSDADLPAGESARLVASPSE
jgi:aryl-alcohol dehydrogenase-like predicted oxidoreductase